MSIKQTSNHVSEEIISEKGHLNIEEEQITQVDETQNQYLNERLQKIMQKVNSKQFYVNEVTSNETYRQEFVTPGGEENFQGVQEEKNYNELQILDDQKIKQQDIQNEEQQDNDDRIIVKHTITYEQMELELLKIKSDEQLQKYFSGNEIKSINNNTPQQYSQTCIFTQDFIQKVRVLFTKLMIAQIPVLTMMIDTVIYEEEINYDALQIKLKGYIVNQAVWYKIRKYEFNFYAVHQNDIHIDLRESLTIVDQIQEYHDIKNYVLFYKFKNIENESFLKRDKVESTIKQLYKNSSKSFETKTQIHTKQQNQSDQTDEIQQFYKVDEINDRSGSIEKTKFNNSIENPEDINILKDEVEKINFDLEQIRKSQKSQIVHYGKQLSFSTEDLLESAQSQFKKLMKDEIPPLTVMIDTVIYKQEINYDAQIIKFKGFTVNKAVWYKLRKFEYTLYVVNKSDVQDFELNLKSKLKPFPESDLLKNFCVYHEFNNIQNEQFFKASSLQKYITEIQSQ